MTNDHRLDHRLRNLEATVREHHARAERQYEANARRIEEIMRTLARLEHRR